MAPKVELHLVSWNRPKMTELVIRTIKRNTNPENYRLSVLDNGSNPETVDMLANLHNNGLIDELHLMNNNAGLEEARQWLLLNCTYPTTEYFVCIDNDCLAPPIQNLDWIERMINLMIRYEDYAAISMRTQVMIGTGNIFEKADQVGDDIVDFPHPGGSFRMMRVEPTRLVGGWAEGKPGRGTEERYICGQLREVGFKTAFATKVQCLHLFGDRAQTTERWGYAEGMAPEETGHSDISHPALTNGDDKQEVLLFAGEEHANRYFS